MAGSTLLLSLVLSLTLAACAAEEPPQDFVRLLELGSDSGTAATLGRETRLATGPAGTVLLTESFAAGTKIPPYVGLPPHLAESPRLILNFRVWDHPDHTALPGVRVAQTSRAAAVERGAKPARTKLDIGIAPVDGKIQIQAIGFPVAENPATVHQFDLTLPSAPVLAFGFGLREESWQGDAERTRFQVSLGRGSSATPLVDRWVDPARHADRRWFDERIDLGRWSGKPVTLSFTTTREQKAGRHSLPAWSDPVVYDADVIDRRPNVIVVSIDTLRARNLRVYGYERDTAPFIDSLAEAGTVFEDAITTSVTTAPSHMSLFTGLYPVRHGIRRGNEVKPANVPTLAAAFRAAGYQTAAFTENGYLVRPRGFGDGFSTYTENRAPIRKVDAATPGAAIETRLAEPTDSRVTFSQARDWIAANQRSPFFAFIHTYEVHTPYRARSPYESMFADDGFPGPPTPEIRAERDNYDREIRVVDDELRALFETLTAEDLDQNTIVVVLADHGEEFHEHGLLQHGGNVYDETLRIPLIFWSPGRIPGGHRVSGAVSLIDVAPTLLDLVGLPPLGSLDGQSLRDTIADGANVPPRQLFAEAVSPRRWVDIWRFEDWNPPLVAVRSSGSKTIVHRPKQGERQPTVRFDLVHDPLERDPIPVSGTELAEVEALVDRHLGQAGSGAAGPGPNAAGQMSPDVQDRLRALGYSQ